MLCVYHFKGARVVLIARLYGMCFFLGTHEGGSTLRTPLKEMFLIIKIRRAKARPWLSIVQPFFKFSLGVPAACQRS